MAIDMMVDSAKLNREMLATANALRERGETESAIPWEDETGFEQAVLAIKGGGDLNFEVVGGTTQPSNPKENTIWVNTSTEITGWIFSAEEPASPVSGMVWFKTEGYTDAGFNAVEDNGIYVYPASAEQYISGAWEPATAMTYKNGTWIDWKIYIFNKGIVSSAGEWNMSVDNGGEPYCNLAVDKTLDMNCDTPSAITNYVAEAFHEISVSKRENATLNIHFVSISAANGNSGNPPFRITTTNGDFQKDYLNLNKTDWTLQIDISDASDSFILVFYSRPWGSLGSYLRMSVDKIWLS